MYIYIYLSLGTVLFENVYVDEASLRKTKGRVERNISLLKMERKKLEEQSSRRPKASVLDEDERKRKFDSDCASARPRDDFRRIQRSGSDPAKAERGPTP